MKVVRGQGKKGEIKEVSDGYARNYLLPRKLASEATADALNAIKLKEKAKAAQAAKEKAIAQEYAEKLEAFQVTIRAKQGEGRCTGIRRKAGGRSGDDPGEGRKQREAVRRSHLGGDQQGAEGSV